MARASREERASALRREIHRLETERAAVLRTILELRHLFAASLSTVYRTCGKPNCACARGERHGPYDFVILARRLKSLCETRSVGSFRTS